MTTDLRALSAAGEGPFALSLADGSTLQCARIVRRVPGRRLVCQGVWQQQAVYAKIFLGRDAARYAGRDRRGAQWLAERGLATPALLHTEALSDGTQVLVYAAIPDSSNAEERMQVLVADDAARLALFKALVQTVADHHNAGLLQTDLYFKNFLVQGEHIYTLDGDGIRPLRGWCARRQALSNLARLLSKPDVADDRWIPELYLTYCARRGWVADAATQRALAAKALAIRRDVIRGYANSKVFRECSDVHVARAAGSWRAIARAWVGRLGNALDAPDSLLEGAGNVRLKSGNTCTVGLTELAGRKLVVKRYNIKNLRHSLGRALRPSRAAASWSAAYRLLISGMPTAAPVAMLERRWGMFRREAYFLAEYVDGPDIAELMADPAVLVEYKQQAVLNTARLLRKMQRLQLEHGDFKATNIKMVDLQPVLIDLDSLREHRCGWLFRRRHARDLRRLLKNWQNDPAGRALMRQALDNVYGNDPVLAGITRD